jgi:hypothetical protein
MWDIKNVLNSNRSRWQVFVIPAMLTAVLGREKKKEQMKVVWESSGINCEEIRWQGRKKNMKGLVHSSTFLTKFFLANDLANT